MENTRVRVSQKGTDGEKHFGNGEGRAPLVFQNIETDAAIGVDVGVEDLRCELHLGWLERVIGREVNIQEELRGANGDPKMHHL